jgi:hypothetical protein
MSWATLTGPIDTATLLRRGLLLLAAVGIAGTGVELVFLRHWSSLTQLIVWPALEAPSAQTDRQGRAWRSRGGQLTAIRWSPLELLQMPNLGAS